MAADARGPERAQPLGLEPRDRAAGGNHQRAKRNPNGTLRELLENGQSSTARNTEGFVVCWEVEKIGQSDPNKSSEVVFLFLFFWGGEPWFCQTNKII